MRENIMNIDNIGDSETKNPWPEIPPAPAPPPPPPPPED